MTKDNKDIVFKKLKALLDPLGVSMFHTDDWGSYERNIEPEKHTISKKNTQAIERKTLRSAPESNDFAVKLSAFPSRKLCMIPLSVS